MKRILKWLGGSILIITTTTLLLIHLYGPTVGAKFGMPIHLFPPSAKRYGEIAIEIIDSNAYYADSEEWDIQKEIALNEMKTLASYEEAYPIIEKSLKVAGGKHSSLLLKDSENKEPIKDEMPIIDKIDDILIVELPPILDAQSNGQKYAEIVLEFLKINQEVKGVIIDLQDNTGGDMGPMVTAVSPLLPDGEILFFAKSHNEWPVLLEDNRVLGGGTEIITDISPFKLNVPVALLTNEKTASSAEALVMSFTDLDRAKTFGQSTAGYASANVPYALFDGAIMFLTTAFNQTPNGKMFYEEPIPVDFPTNKPYEDARIWLEDYQ